VGIELSQISDADLKMQIQIAWELIAPARLIASFRSAAAE
jgi:hypothetical protein